MMKLPRGYDIPRPQKSERPLGRTRRLPLLHSAPPVQAAVCPRLRSIPRQGKSAPLRTALRSLLDCDAALRSAPVQLPASARAPPVRLSFRPPTAPASTLQQSPIPVPASQSLLSRIIPD